MKIKTHKHTHSNYETSNKTISEKKREKIPPFIWQVDKDLLKKRCITAYDWFSGLENIVQEIKIILIPGFVAVLPGSGVNYRFRHYLNKRSAIKFLNTHIFHISIILLISIFKAELCPAHSPQTLGEPPPSSSTRALWSPWSN